MGETIFEIRWLMAVTYRVRRGDSLSLIAKRQYKDASLWPEIARANHLKDPYTIFVGQELVIPNQCRNTSFPPMSWSSEPQMSLHDKFSVNGPLAPRPSTISSSLMQESKGAPVSKKAASALPDPPTARPVLMPAFKFELENVIQPVTVSNGAISYTFQLKGEITIQSEKPLQNFSIVNLKQFALEAKSEADVVVGDVGSRIASSTEFKYDPTSKSMEISTSLKTELTLKGDVWVTQSISPVLPNGIKYTYQPRALSGKIRGLKIEGNIALEITVRVNPEQPKPQPVPVLVPGWQKVAAAGLFVVSAGIIIATLAEDIVTIGGGVADDPASFGAAAAVYSAASVMWTGPLQDRGIIVNQSTPTDL